MSSTHPLRSFKWYKVGNNSKLGLGILPLEVKVDFDGLWSRHPQELGKVMMRGKLIDTPRFQSVFGYDYTFTGMNHPSDPIPDWVDPFLQWANSLGFGKFNQSIVNWYQNGHHYIGSHADDKEQLRDGTPVIGISLGATRKFRLRDKFTKKIVADVEANNRSVIIMAGKFQDELKHEVVKIAGKKGEKVGPRMSITFRQFDTKMLGK